MMVKYLFISGRMMSFHTLLLSNTANAKKKHHGLSMLLPQLSKVLVNIRRRKLYEYDEEALYSKPPMPKAWDAAIAANGRL